MISNLPFFTPNHSSLPDPPPSAAGECHEVRSPHALRKEREELLLHPLRTRAPRNRRRHIRQSALPRLQVHPLRFEMASTVAGVSAVVPYSSLSSANSKPSDLNPKFCSLPLNCSSQSFSAFRSRFCITKNAPLRPRFSPIAYSSSPVVSSEYLEEPQTKVKYQTSLSLPGCSSSLSLLGTGYREKVFAIIGVKVYAAGLYANPSIFSKLDAWKGRSSAELHKDSSLFDAIYQAPLEKSLHIILVRDLDGKTFWDALDEALSPRIKSPTPVDETALSTFRGIFQGRPLQKGTSIFLTWLDTAKMLFFVTPEGIPSSVDAAIESSNVTSALFDVFLGGNPVSPSLRASACIGLAAALK